MASQGIYNGIHQVAIYSPFKIYYYAPGVGMERQPR